MRALVLVACAACSCSSKSADPVAVADPIPGDDNPGPQDATPQRMTGDMSPRALTVSITLPTAQNAQPVPAGTIIVALVKDELRVLTGNEPIEVNGGAIAKLPASRPVLPEELLQHDRVLVVADLGARVERILDLPFPLHQTCWALAAASAGKLAATWPKPCPAERLDKPDFAELAVYLDAAQIYVGSSRTNASDAIAMPELANRLAHPGSDFEKRSDLVFGVAPDVSVGVVVAALQTMYAAGFTNARWVPAVWLPVRFSNGIGTYTPPPPPPLPPGAPPPGPPSITLGGTGSIVAADIERVIKARAGIWRACYQKELNRTPGIGGKLIMTFDIGPDGAVTSAQTSGTLTNTNVTTCVKANFLRLRFPPTGSKARIRYALAFTP